MFSFISVGFCGNTNITDPCLLAGIHDVNKVLKRYGFISGDGDLGLAGIAVTGEQLLETSKIIVVPLDRHRAIFSNRCDERYITAFIRPPLNMCRDISDAIKSGGYLPPRMVPMLAVLCDNSASLR